MIKFVSDLLQVSGFLLVLWFPHVLWFPPPLKLKVTLNTINQTKPKEIKIHVILKENVPFQLITNKKIPKMFTI